MTGGGSSADLREQSVRATRRRELMAAAALIFSILGFVGQTELLGLVSSQGYHKPIFVMYITHSAMLILFPLQIVALWLIKPNQSFTQFYRKHTAHLKATAKQIAKGNPPLPYLVKAAVILCVSLNVAGAAWYIAVGLTSTSDLTAIYNCSTFFAYLFSVILLKESWHVLKAVGVALSIVGVVFVAYGGSSSVESRAEFPHRALGNLIIASGTVLYGLYEVLYKKIACPPQSVSAKKQAAFANLAGSFIGAATLLLMWPVLIVLHIAGWETFALPDWQLGKYLVLSVFSNVMFSGCFLILMSLTSPVLGSVSSLLATFMVPTAEWLIFGRGMSIGELVGGLIILASFALMTWVSRHDLEEDGLDDD